MPVENGATQQESANPLETDDFAAYVAARTRTEEPEEKPSEAAGDKPDAPETTPQDSDPGDEDQELTDEHPVRGRGIQKRFDKLTAKIRDLEAQVASKPGIASPNPTANEPAKDVDDPEPDPDKFTDYEKYVEEKVRWKDRVEAKAQAKVAAETKAKADAEKTLAEYSARVKELVKQPEYADFGTKVSPLSTKLHPAIAEAILTDDNGPQVAYTVASDAKLLERLEGMSLPQAIRELGKLSAKFDKAPEPPKPPASNAPAPPKPVSARSSQSAVEKSIYDEDLDPHEYRKIREAQLRRK